MQQRFVALSLIAVVIAGMAGLAGAGAAGPMSPTRLTPEDVLAAALSRSDLKSLVPDPGRWWPAFPQFNNPALGIGFPDLPGERFYVGQVYHKVGDPDARRLESILLLFTSPQRAAEGFAAIADHPQADRGGTTVPGPRVGDEHRYFTRSRNQVNETTVRFRAGAVVGRVTVRSRAGHEQAATVARYAAPVVRKVEALLAGRLKATPLPAELARRMPPADAGAAVGPVLGSAVLIPEAWAVDAGGDAEKDHARLRQFGMAQSAVRRYALRGVRGHVIEATVVPLKDAQAAARFLQGTVDEAPQKNYVRLPAANTGPQSYFYRQASGNYELQFVRGRYVASAYCQAQFEKTTEACEAPVRQLGERWYAAMPAR